VAARAAGVDGVKLHVGCGSIYLREWVNVDLPLSTVFLAKERKDLIDRYGTIEDAYYSRHAKSIDDWREGPRTLDTVCDVYGSFQFLPARDKSAEQILSRQCFEHLTLDKAVPALEECARVLAWGGRLRLDVPDPEETVRLYGKTGDAFYIRHLFGPRQSVFGVHTFYNRELLKTMASRAGFNFVQENPNIHPYPAFELEFVLS
jgi:predicted SAM-dependent methyltransferase